MIKDPKEYNDRLNEALPPSILRPPDISDIFHRILNESSVLNCPLEFSSNAPVADKSSHLIIPRPKVGWPLRKVTFGKSNLDLYVRIINMNNVKYVNMSYTNYLIHLQNYNKVENKIHELKKT